MRKSIKKAIIKVLSMILFIGIINHNTTGALNETYNVQERFLGEWKAVPGDVGLRGSGTILTINGETSFCLQPNKAAHVGSNQLINFNDIGINDTTRQKLALIRNFGYMSQPSDTNAILTQNLIWRFLGHSCGYVSATHGYPTLQSQESWFNDVLNKVENYRKMLSFHNEHVEINVGDRLELTDTNNVLSSMQIVSSDGLNVTISNNMLLVTGTEIAEDNSLITFVKPLASGQQGINFIVRNGNSQAVSILKTSDPSTAKLYVKVNKNYQVAFNGNGATSGNMDNQTFLYNQAQKLNTNVFKKVGHTFVGWNTAANGTGTSFSNGQVVKNIGSPNSTVSLYAIWKNTKPAIVVPTIKYPDKQTNSNIAPSIDSGKIVIQKGDTFDPLDFVTANDEEDGDITSKIVIRHNPVPVDKSKKTTQSGEFVVEVAVSDSGGLTTTDKLVVLVNEPPTIKAEDRWFLQDQVVNQEELLKKVEAKDKEDGDVKSKVAIEYIKYHDGRLVNGPTFFDTTFINESGKDDIKQTISEIKYTVTDKYHASATTIAKLYIVRDKQKFKEKRKQYIRFISSDYMNSLDATSIWKQDKSLYTKLVATLQKKDSSKAKANYSFTNTDVQDIKKWLKNNKASQVANQTFIKKYLNTHKLKGNLD